MRMIRWAIYGMIYLGSLLMIYNIFGFIRFSRYIRARGNWGQKMGILYIPVVLLVLFLVGYLAVGFLGKPDLIVAGILFGGSVFVFVMYKLLSQITAHIIENESLEARVLAAEESSKAKTSFLASISHEMRTPMNVILGQEALAQKNPDLPEETRKQLTAIGQSGRHLLGLINNILEMQQIETGEIPVRRESFSLTETMAQITAIASTQCGAKGLQWQYSREEALEDQLSGDAMLLKQVLLSLLDNAVKFTDAPGTVSLSVCSAAREGDECTLRFTVSDSGVGMSPDFVDKAFELFTQEDDSFSNRYGGSGIGMTAAKRKTELMGGQLTLQSEKGKGTVVTATVPFHVSRQAFCAPEPSYEEVSLEGRRVLIVEDMDENAEITADLLELEGVESERAENGQAALQMFTASPLYSYDAVLMDLRMPVMDGLEAARRIRSLQRADAAAVPIIALTANAFETDVQHSLEAGMSAHLVKPVEAELLYKTLKHWIGLTHAKEGETNA